MKKPAFFITLIIFTIIVLTIAYVMVSSSLSTTGILLNDIEKKINVYKRENANLREKVLFASSFTNIASEASQLGFVESKSEVFLTTPLPLAVKPCKGDFILLFFYCF